MARKEKKGEKKRKKDLGIFLASAKKNGLSRLNPIFDQKFVLNRV